MKLTGALLLLAAFASATPTYCVIALENAPNRVIPAATGSFDYDPVSGELSNFDVWDGDLFDFSAQANAFPFAPTEVQELSIQAEPFNWIDPNHIGLNMFTEQCCSIDVGNGIGTF